MILTLLEASQLVAKKYSYSDQNNNENNKNSRRLIVDEVAKKPVDAAVAANSAPNRQPIAVIGLGLGLSVLFVSLFLAFVLAAVMLPALQGAQGALHIVLPGFTLFSWWRIVLGVFESFAWGWYVGLIFGSAYNYLVTRRRR